MMTIQEIETACEKSQPLDFSRHEIDAPELPLTKMFYPFGFPAEVRSNSAEVLVMMEDLWGKFEKQHDTEPILADVHVVEGSSTECPPAPVYRFMKPLLLGVADGDNYCISDLQRTKSQITISHAALQSRLYAGYFFLGTPATHVATRFTTPVHAGCVALDGRGVLLCGDSGAGKSTLSYACARAGWTYISDDGSFVINDRKDRMVTGDCYRVRFRPATAELFPELNGLEITPRAAGKPSIELPTANLPHMSCAPTAQVDYIVFVNRHSGGSPELRPYRKDVARYAMQQVFYGMPEMREKHNETIDRLLEAEIFELRYTDLDWGIERLQRLVREGR
ncbi:aldolase [Granulicella sp. WH15]|uniref:aldolase n=1 Tax=Granulicella sp. WH15 TaxID=2602070 RepID=UPI001366AB07|nr:aldolase [Granulicella sp. WH15]QHN03573.1 aldolase [Granulicella sp. WH15]